MRHTLFEDRVKMSDFQIFIDSDRKNVNFYMAFTVISLAHFILAQNGTVKEQNFAEIYNFIL